MVRPEQPDNEKEIKDTDRTMNEDDDEDEMIGSNYRSEVKNGKLKECELEHFNESPKANTERANNSDDELEEENSPLK